MLKWDCRRSLVCVSRKPASSLEYIPALLIRRLSPVSSKAVLVCSNADAISSSFVTSNWRILRLLFSFASAWSSSALRASIQEAKRNCGGEGWERNCLTNSKPSPRLAPVIKTDRGPISSKKLSESDNLSLKHRPMTKRATTQMVQEGKQLSRRLRY